MILRKFEQEWEEQISPVNHMKECNALCDLFDYVSRLQRDVISLHKYYHEEFNKVSNKPLENYATSLKKMYEQMYELCIKKDTYGKFLGYTHSMENIREQVYIQTGSKFKINDKYYKALSKIAKNAFEIEDEIAKINEMLWLKTLTDASKYSLGAEYSFLAHVDYKTMPREKMSKEFKKYNDCQQGLCFSLVNDKKTRLYDNSLSYYNYYSHPYGLVGIIAKPQPGAIVGISDDDMLSTEYIDGECNLVRHFDHSKVNRCFARDNSEIYCRGTRTFPPKALFDLGVDTINEIILDSKKIDIQAVFYVKDRNGKMPERLVEYKKQQEKICGHKLNVIELNPRNRMNQVNLEMVFNDY